MQPSGAVRGQRNALEVSNITKRMAVLSKIAKPVWHCHGVPSEN